jgi:RNA polymerase sigma-70 factor (ECF subfamily)
MNSRPSNAGIKDLFSTTRWTMVVAAVEGSPTVAKALAELCQTYWMPLYTYLRHRGHRPAEAEDLVQAFFTQLIEKDVVAAADRQRGRFRSFLITSLQHFVSNRRVYDSAQKRGGAARTLDLDFGDAEAAYHREPSTDVTPEKLFEREWAMGLLDLVLSRLAREYADAGKSELFNHLRPLLTGGGAPATHATIAASLGTSPDAIKMAASRMRGRYRELLRQTIADTVASPEEVDDEIRHLFTALSA